MLRLVLHLVLPLLSWFLGMITNGVTGMLAFCICRLNSIYSSVNFNIINFCSCVPLIDMFLEWILLQQPSVGPYRAHGVGGSAKLNTAIFCMLYCTSC